MVKSNRTKYSVRGFPKAQIEGGAILFAWRNCVKLIFLFLNISTIVAQEAYVNINPTSYGVPLQISCQSGDVATLQDGKYHQAQGPGDVSRYEGLIIGISNNYQFEAVFDSGVNARWDIYTEDENGSPEYSLTTDSSICPRDVTIGTKESSYIAILTTWGVQGGGIALKIYFTVKKNSEPTFSIEGINDLNGNKIPSSQGYYKLNSPISISVAMLNSKDSLGKDFSYSVKLFLPNETTPIDSNGLTIQKPSNGWNSGLYKIQLSIKTSYDLYLKNTQNNDTSYTFYIEVDNDAPNVGDFFLKRGNDYGYVKNINNEKITYFSKESMPFEIVEKNLHDLPLVGCSGLPDENEFEAYVIKDSDASTFVFEGNGGLKLNENGLYTLIVTLQDNLGNSREMSKKYAIDGKSPAAVENVFAVWGSKDGKHLDELMLSWNKANDSDTECPAASSGVKKYNVYMKVGRDGNWSLFPSDVEIGVEKCSTKIGFRNSDSTSNYDFCIIAEDNVGNMLPYGKDAGFVSVYYAPLIKVRNSKARLLEVGSPTSSDIIVESVLNVTPEQFENGYQSITLKRQCEGFDDLQGMTFSPADVVKSGGSPAASSWLGAEVLEDGSTVLVYHDQIPAQYGHRTLRYEIEQKRKAPQIIQPDGTVGTERPVPTENTGNDSIVTLPNHWGYLGSIYLADDPDPQKTGRKTLRAGEKKTDFQIGESLKTWLVFTAGDIDAGTSWRYAAYHATPIGDASYEAYAESTLNEDPEKEYKKIITSTPGVELSIPIVLNYEINNIVVSWQEISPETGVAEEDGHPYEMVLSVRVTKTLDGGYELEAFGDTAVHGTDGLICRPGEPVTFTLRNNEGKSFGCYWDFDGDGNDDSNTPVILYRYLQKDDRTGDVSEYTLGLTIEEQGADPNKVSFEVYLPVHVKDTRHGRLYVSEVWRGDHQVLGTVTVPAGDYMGNAVTLSLEPGIDKTMTVSFDRDEVLKPQLGISVESGGRLEIGVGGGTVILRMKEGQTPYWNAIKVMGNAVIANALISGAERAVAVGGSGIADMSDVELSGNKIGLHIVGSEATVTVKNAKIKQNTEYGVKEDSGGNPAFGGSASDSEERNVEVSENYRDYYDWREGLLSAEELKAVNGIIRK